MYFKLRQGYWNLWMTILYIKLQYSSDFLKINFKIETFIENINNN